MARKTESGIDYFPINTDIISNPKVKLVVAEFGSKTTWAVLLPLYCKIYREKGYWIDWCDEDSKLLFAQDECKLELSVVNEVVNGCIRRCLFDKAVFEMFGILTSDRIQANYFEATARRTRVYFIDEFLVKNDDVDISRKNVNILSLNVDVIKKKVNIGAQKKKKIIEEEEKGEGESAKAQTYTPEEKDNFEKFKTYIKDNAPSVGRFQNPFTIDQYLKLKGKFTTNEIVEMLLKMDNYKPLLKKNTHAYQTFLNWSKKDFNGGESKRGKTTGASSLSSVFKGIQNDIQQQV